jgi:uncharacterized protein YbjT (DUF2867 family)
MNYCITGAFGYSGTYIANEILAAGHELKTLTNNPGIGHPLSGKISSFSFNFDALDKITEFLNGSDVLINNYWVRFNHSTFNHNQAVENSFRLFDCALEAGVKRIVHVSITNPSLDSDLEYFKGKAEIEEYLKNTGISYCILRPTVLFGKEDVLINNIAWFIRNFPMMGVFGDGNYKIQPVFVEDLAKLAVNASLRETNETIDAIGPETFTYKELVLEVMKAIDLKKTLINVNPTLAYLIGKLISTIKSDVTITKPEIVGLMRGLLATDSASPCKTKFSEWINENSQSLGQKYTNELKRRNY